MPTRCAVIGQPVHHSLSPVLHRAAYAALGLDWEYSAVELDVAGLDDFLAGLDESWRGLSCTMPHKEAIVGKGRPDAVVDLVGVANTLVFEGRPTDPDTTVVRNTDVSGFRLALSEYGLACVSSATIVGNGATARSCLVALAQHGATAIELLARDPHRAEPLRALASRVGVELQVTALGEPPAPSEIVVSTVPVAGSGPHADELAAVAPVLFDSVYDPWPTPLASAGQGQGRLVLSGLDLLAAQAVDQIRWMVGDTVDFTTLRTAARTAIAARSHT